MRIVSWNCNGAFRKKIDFISNLDADINVIQECENPLYINDHNYKIFSTNYFWTGINKNKGLGIFTKKDKKITLNNWNKYSLRNFLSIRINDSFDLIGIWAMPPYIEEYYSYQNINSKNYNSNTIIVGNFNSNAIWDKAHKEYCHSNVVNELQCMNLESCYHFYSKENMGSENKATFYRHKNPDKPFHIDYCFLNTDRLINFKVGDYKPYIDYSDHMPLIIAISD